jgi:hypothetical protein
MAVATWSLFVEDGTKRIYVSYNTVIRKVSSIKYKKDGTMFIELGEDRNQRVYLHAFHKKLLRKVESTCVFGIVVCAILYSQLNIAIDDVDPAIRGNVTAISAYMDEMDESDNCIEELETIDKKLLVGLLFSKIVNV